MTLLGTGPGESRTDLAGAEGRVDVSGFGPGAVRLVVSAEGYAERRSAFDLPDRLAAPFTVVVRLGRLSEIGRTSAQPRGGSAERIVDPGSPVRRISSDLLDALGRLGGVSVLGNPAVARIGLRGRDPSETSFTLNGTPVGVNAAQLAVNGDLLQAADVDSAHDSIAFSLLSPTVEPLQTAEAGFGGYGASLVRSTFQGTSGRIGYALAHAERGSDSVLDRRVYRDLSGLTYRHVGQLVTIGDYAKVALPVGDWSLSVSDAVTRSAGNPLPAYLAGSVPAGVGPGERRTTNAENAIVVANGTVRGLALSLNASSWSFRAYDDERSRVAAAGPAPLTLMDTTSGRSVQGYASAAVGERRTVELLGTLTWTRTSAGFAEPGAAAANAAAAVRRTFKLTERWKLDPDRSLLASAVLDSDGTALLPTLRLEERLRHGGADRSLSLEYARKPVRFDVPENVRMLFDPRSASYDCGGRVISAAVAGDAAAQPTVLAANASVASRGTGWHVQAGAYYELQRNLLLTGASQRADALATAALAPFVNDLVNGFGSFGGCSGSVTAADVTLIRDVAGASVRYDGIELAGGFGVGKTLLFEADVAMQQAVATALPPALSSARSYYAVGRQLPNVPYWNGTASLDWQSNDGRTEALANATLISANNRKNLPAVTLFSVAVQRAFSPKLLVTAVATNVTGAYPGAFTSARYAMPYLLADGTLQPALAAPELPPRLFVSLSYRSR